MNQRRFFIRRANTEQRHFSFYGTVMNYARRLARRAASRKGCAAVKDQTRRGFFAERLEDRSLMAADLLSFSQFHNYSRPMDVDADGAIAPADVLVIINSIN